MLNGLARVARSGRLGDLAQRIADVQLDLFELEVEMHDAAIAYLRRVPTWPPLDRFGRPMTWAEIDRTAAMIRERRDFWRREAA